MKYVGEKLEFGFAEVIDGASGQVEDHVVGQVTTVWSVAREVKALCEAMSRARGEGSPESEVRRVVMGEYDLTRRELDRQNPPGDRGALDFFLDADPTNELIEMRLADFELAAQNEFARQAYVLDAALARWGYFIGNVRFREGRTVRRSRQRTVRALFEHTIPRTAEELLECVSPWLEQLEYEELKEALLAAVAAASRLDGTECRRLCEVASTYVPPAPRAPER